MRRIFSMILIIGLIATLTGTGINAYFNDTETTSNNTFTAGTLDLKLSHSSAGPWTDGVAGTWTLSNMKPGDQTSSRSVFFKNFGTITSRTMTVACNYIVIEETPQTEADTDPNTDLHPDEMAKSMIIAMIRYKNDEVDIDCFTGYDSWTLITKNDWKINDANGDGKISLYELKIDPLINLPSPDLEPNKETQLDMVIKFDETAGNDFQGDTFDLEMVFTLNQ